MLFGDPERDAAAGAAAIEAEHQPGLFRCSPVHKGVNAERAMLADQPGRHLLDELEPGPPHQRAIAEHPEVCGAAGFRVSVGQFGFGYDFGCHLRRRLAETGLRSKQVNPEINP